MTTRREFIRTTAATGLVASLPGFATSSATAANQSTSTTPLPRPRPMAANEEVRCAVIGVRSRGNNHVHALQRLSNVSVVALCDCDQAVLDARAGEFEKSQGRSIDAFLDYRRLLERDDIHCISIATPNHWHALMAVESCRAGKDVYVEKPVSHNIGEGPHLLAAARDELRIVQTGTQSRSTQAIIDGIQWVQDGHLGDIVLARGLCYKPRQSIGCAAVPHEGPDSLDFNLWTGPAALQPLHRPNLHYDWHWDTNTGNGDIGNQGVHQVDICRWAVGARAMPRRVASIGGRLGYEDCGNTPNTQVAFFDYGTAPIIFEVRGLPRDKEAQRTNWGGGMDTYMGQRIAALVHCTNGTLVVTHSRTCDAIDLEGNLVKRFEGGGDHFANFIEAVRSRDPGDLNAGILEGVRSSDLCHLANISHHVGTPGSAADATDMAAEDDAFAEATGRMLQHLQRNGIDCSSEVLAVGSWLNIDPVKERFTNSEAANTLIARDGRPPYTFPTLS